MGTARLNRAQGETTPTFVSWSLAFIFKGSLLIQILKYRQTCVDNIPAHRKCANRCILLCWFNFCVNVSRVAAGCEKYAVWCMCNASQPPRVLLIYWTGDINSHLNVEVNMQRISTYLNTTQQLCSGPLRTVEGKHLFHKNYWFKHWVGFEYWNNPLAHSSYNFDRTLGM